MGKIKKYGSFVFGMLLSILTLILGAGSGVLMANATPMPDAGVTASGDHGSGAGGIATESQGREDGDPEFYSKEIDDRIIKIRPMSSPIDQISRHARATPSESFEVKYYSVGTRPLVTTLKAKVERQVSGASVAINVADTNIFTEDDTIRVVGVKAEFDHNGVAYDKLSAKTPDLVLCVCGRDQSSSLPTVYAVNGLKDDNGRPIWLPEIPEGTKLVRMGKAVAELDVQTGRFNNLPTSEVQYCQNFMIQIEESTLNAIAKKEVNWDFSEQEEDGIYDMRRAQENSYLFGGKNKINHPTKNGMTTWFTGGIWYMAGKDIEVGKWNPVSKEAEISDKDLVDISKELFLGSDGNKRKLLFLGSEIMAAFSKIGSERFQMTQDTVEVWNITFRRWKTNFGEILVLHHDAFDECGMSDCGFALDPEYLSKKTHVSWARYVLDLKKAGVRDTNAVVLREISCIYLRNANAHARLKLASA